MQIVARPRPTVARAAILALAALVGSLATMLAIGPASSAQTTDVSIIDNDYDPATIVVATGTEVTWTNRGELLHDVVALRGEFRSRRFRTGESFSFVFNEPGRYDYQCTVHWSMSGIVEVYASANDGGQPAHTPTPTPTPTDGMARRIIAGDARGGHHVGGISAITAGTAP